VRGGSEEAFSEIMRRDNGDYSAPRETQLRERRPSWRSASKFNERLMNEVFLTHSEHT